MNKKHHQKERLSSLRRINEFHKSQHFFLCVTIVQGRILRHANFNPFSKTQEVTFGSNNWQKNTICTQFLWIRCHKIKDVYTRTYLFPSHIENSQKIFFPEKRYLYEKQCFIPDVLFCSHERALMWILPALKVYNSTFRLCFPPR